MQIIIPMSGFGERFRQAGYKLPKPLIEVEGQPIISYVIAMFPKETKFIFVCNQEHLDEPAFRMREVLQQYCPTGKVVGIASHKLGPVYAVSQAFEWIDDAEAAIVNYCDFTCDWDYGHFKSWLDVVKPDGCVPAYQGFHPHSLGSTYYAYIKHKGLWLEAIQEKKPFTDKPMEEFASSGTYYFKSGALLKHYFQEVQRLNLHVNHEFYVSMVYQPMADEGKKVAVYPLNHFMQWGTPADLQVYLNWSSTFARLNQPSTQLATLDATMIMPMVGVGKRFQEYGYTLPKPLIPVSGKAMVLQALASFPRCNNYRMVIRKDLPHVDDLTETLYREYPQANVIALDAMTEGQAETCLIAARTLLAEQPILIAACDSGVLFDEAAYQRLHADLAVDVIVWVARGHATAAQKPQMYGWVEVAEDGKTIQRVSVKTPLQDPSHDPIVVGAFTFKRADMFIKATEAMMNDNHRINNEFYVDACINYAIKQGLRCEIFEVEHYLCWGTPDELATFNYWQAAFHHWPLHPYRLHADSFIASEHMEALDTIYQAPKATLPDMNESR